MTHNLKGWIINVYTSTDGEGGGVFLLTGPSTLCDSWRGECLGLLSCIFLLSDFLAGGVMGGATGLGRSDSTCLRLGNGECWSTLAAVGVLDTVGLRVCNVLSLSVNLISGLLPSLLGECLKMVKASFSLCARAAEARLWDAARIAPGSILKINHYHGMKPN